ncbi:MAG: class II fumarate hydratase [Calditrichaeota bacterium]|nr:class II fumarate hydratase [Calditrichota bacterium]MCB0269475.1 class II fumarate hydratase [Calditrichota bacterium]
MAKKGYRIEKDSMGEMQVPVDAYWGAQTQRAVENFPISGYRFPRAFIRALGMIKHSAAQTNLDLKRLDKKIAKAIMQAAEEVMEGKLDAQFVLDIFQTGSGTSTNMNTNEVIANRANEILGGKIGDRSPIHPNDHVNKGQSSNDVIPTAMHIAALESIVTTLIPALSALQKTFDKKAKEFDKIVKIGRTHLQDATPIRLGQEFGGYASMLKHGVKRLEHTGKNLSELAIGGTAVGTGINTHPDFAKGVCKRVSETTGIKFTEADNHFEAQGAKDAYVEASGALKTVAVSLMKIANDIRWLGSGPRCGIGEILLPEVQPGSSIMPGKVNPVIAEAMCMVCAQVIGNDAAIAVGGMFGNFELNVMMPLMAHNMLESITLLSNAINVFNEKCVSGIRADVDRNTEMIEKSLAMCTSLVPHIGYDQSAAIAKEAYKKGKTVREVAKEKQLIDEKTLNEALDPWSMTEPS